ncbi:MAG: hypothetical protein ACRDD1_07090 [Planctomycetia bacterium]
MTDLFSSFDVASRRFPAPANAPAPGAAFQDWPAFWEAAAAELLRRSSAVAAATTLYLEEYALHYRANDDRFSGSFDAYLRVHGAESVRYEEWRRSALQTSPVDVRRVAAVETLIRRLEGAHRANLTAWFGSSDR